MTEIVPTNGSLYALQLRVNELERLRIKDSAAILEQFRRHADSVRNAVGRLVKQQVALTLTVSDLSRLIDARLPAKPGRKAKRKR